MSILTSIYNHTLGLVIPLALGPQNTEATSRKRKFDDEDERGTALRRRKREDSEENKEVITKRRRVDEDRFAPIVNGETYESTLISAPSTMYDNHDHTMSEYGRKDRSLMPPPALSPLKIRSSGDLMEEEERRIAMDFDETSLHSLATRVTQQKTSDEFMNEYDMEKARRHAAATTLPANSGVWERGEKELFFHLSYRGFEPMFPHNWMTDFRTMPISLFAREEEDSPGPLIRVHREKGDFRAIRELRELLDLGKSVRDKVLSSPGAKREDIIEKATKKYIAWALGDIGIKLRSSVAAKNVLPIHVIVKLKTGQNTTSCLLEMKNKLHTLRARHYQARNIHESIERDATGYATPDSGDETRIAETSEGDVPVLYGIMVCKSILAIFTLNNRTPSPTQNSPNPFIQDGDDVSIAGTESNYGKTLVSVSSTEANMKLKKFLKTRMKKEEPQDDSASDPRFISDFDFSDPARDVWNALVIAILAIQIRKDILMATRSEISDDSLEDIRAGIEENSIADIDDDPDA